MPNDTKGPDQAVVVSQEYISTQIKQNLTKARRLVFLDGECVYMLQIKYVMQLSYIIMPIFCKRYLIWTNKQKGIRRLAVCLWWSPICKPYHDGTMVELWLWVTNNLHLQSMPRKWIGKLNINIRSNLGYQRSPHLEQNCCLGVKKASTTCAKNHDWWLQLLCLSAK
jgi:hypothetical protein